jgi:hypothetical protein
MHGIIESIVAHLGKESLIEIVVAFPFREFIPRLAIRLIVAPWYTMSIGIKL